MSNDDKKYNKKQWLDESDGAQGDGEKGSSGASGHIEFQDFLAAGLGQRDDLLSPDERKRLISVHKETHERRVQEQLNTAKERKALKEGKLSLRSFYENMREVVTAVFKTHPISRKAQFSGKDRQVNEIPGNVAETNNDKRNELQYQYNLRHRPQHTHTPKFNPKPTYR